MSTAGSLLLPCRRGRCQLRGRHTGGQVPQLPALCLPIVPQWLLQACCCCERCNELECGALAVLAPLCSTLRQRSLRPALAAVPLLAVTRSFPDDYPGEELSLKLTDAANLAEPAVRQLSKQLHQAAAHYAAEGEVCCFQLVTLAQEFLQQHNRPPEEDEGAVPLSLWHEMQQVRAGGDAGEAGQRKEAWPALPAWHAGMASPAHALRVPANP